jgi:transcription elongation factor Elf1
MAIELTDDGTMDTVLRCSECGEEFRYNFDPGPDEEDGEDAYNAFVDWAIEDAESEHECPADDPESQGPQEDDITTEDHETFYQSGDVVLERARYLGRLQDLWYFFPRGSRRSSPVDLGRFGDDVNAALRAYMDRSQYWPNAWFISDHGNAHLISLSQSQEQE